MKWFSGNKERVLIIEEKDLERPKIDWGKSESLTILYLPVAYSGSTYQETAQKVQEKNPDLWTAVAFALSSGDGRVEFY